MYRILFAALLSLQISVLLAQSATFNKLNVRDTFTVIGQTASDKFQIASDGGVHTIGSFDGTDEVDVYGSQWGFYSDVVLGVNANNNIDIHVDGGGSLTIVDGNEADGYVLTSDAGGGATWQPNNSATGWAQYKDTIFTSSNKFDIANGDTATMPNMAHSIINTYLPTGVDSFYNRADTTLIGVNIGDHYSIRIDFKAEVDVNNGYCDIFLDIGGSQGIILDRVVTFPRGANTAHYFSITTDYYTLNTFVANGGKLRVYAADGDLEMWDINFVIVRIHAAE